MTADNPIWAPDADAEAHRESRINLALLRGVLENLRSNRKTIPLFALAVAVMFVSPMTKFERDIAAYAVVSFPPGRPMLAGAMELMHRIHKDFRYDTTVTDASTPVDRVFEIRAVVCQDLAHVGIAAMRSLGLPARYVSGYLLNQPPPGMTRMLGADASHAWFSV
jgi:transglutaminase-like putative cysteine protease